MNKQYSLVFSVMRYYKSTIFPAVYAAAQIKGQYNKRNLTSARLQSST